MKSETLHLLISGRVQGVGYRASLQREAVARHLDGWVRNLQDGRVEALVSGSSISIVSLLDWIRQGPPNAVVIDVDAHPWIGETPTSGFQLLPTH